jgi:M6 family metalloprotease-like protein
MHVTHDTSRRSPTAGGPLVLAVLVGLAALMAAGSAHAVKAYPFPFTIYQPDGTAISVRMIGDERIVFYETEDGYTILRQSNGWWHYVHPASNGTVALEASRLRVGIDPVPASWPRHIRPMIDPNAPSIPFDIKNDGSIRQLFLERGFGTSSARSALPDSSATSEAGGPPAMGVPVLVILVEFADWKHTSGPGTPLPWEPDYQPIPGEPNSARTWYDLFNDVTVPGGLNHYFDEVSYGQFQWQVEVAQNGRGRGKKSNDGWYTNPETMAYWGADKLQGTYCNNDSLEDRIWNLPRWAIEAADADIDYSRYDTDGDGEISDAELMIFIIHARPGQEYYGDDCWGGDPEHHIWSHQWVLYRRVNTDDGVSFPGRHSYSINPEFEPGVDTRTDPWTVVDKWFGVGVYAHEAFHTLGTPDLYDYGYDANVAGEWDLMDGGSFNGAKSGTHPSHVGAPIKFDLELGGSESSYGWIFADEITDLVDGSVHAEGGYRIEALSGISHDNVMHRMIAPNDPGEWLVLENRAPVGYYEPFLPEFGLIVWHRDLDGTRDNWPYRAAVERAGWANTPEGLNTGTAGAAMSLDDGQTEITSTSDPNTSLNDETPSGLLDTRCVGAETANVSYAYGTLTGTHLDYAGNTVDDPLGDGDGFIDNGETVSLTIAVANSPCATEAAEGVTLTVGVASDSDIPPSAVSIEPVNVALGDIPVGSDLSHEFTVTLACDPDGYHNRTITFAYTLAGANVDEFSGSFTKETDRDYLFSDDMEEDQMGTLWSGTTLREVSTCTSAEGHGDWIWSADLAHNGDHSYHTPEASDNVSYVDPEESLVSPDLAVPPGVALKELSFWHAADIPCPGSSRGRLWLSTDGGTTWSRVESFYKDGGDLSWEQARVNLGSFVGASQFRFKFVMYTYECWTDCTGAEGWYIDDVQVVIDEKDTCSD